MSKKEQGTGMEELVDGELEVLGELLSRVTWDEDPDLDAGIDDTDERDEDESERI